MLEKSESRPSSLQPPSANQDQPEPCRVCEERTAPIFQARILDKHDVAYFRCPGCGLIQTEPPYWLAEAYDQAIANQDVGLVRRNLELAAKLRNILLAHFDPGGRYLDYAGGYGLMVRLMRDEGFDFHRHDPFCTNIFAQNFDLPDLPYLPAIPCLPDLASHRFEAITAFELLEHLQEPTATVRRLLEHTDSLLFSTRLQPDPWPRSVDDWWYFWPQTGQHVTFYTLPTLRVLAEKTGTTLYSDGTALHLLTRRTFSTDPLARPRGVLASLERLLERWRRSLNKRMFPVKPPPSLLPEDGRRAACPRPDRPEASGTDRPK
ncbi:class I SAM-dependent methyltransferase [Desulfonatronum thiodismutans]|uniref:class I SAM-dependent methyltransferase n=1 Tax=Desulfonatronum thiodismutans TaxID=159290 RepID=UPI00068D101C|nr:class I SAM-dependent methyltransferase [Desulfonatronum thiodismutans]